MTKLLDPEVRKLRALSDGALADEAGALKAALGRIKDEAVRRDLRRAEGALFRLTLTPPGRQSRLDRKRLETVYGASVIALYCYETDTDWVMRTSARPIG
jgi:hypothetical protein